MDDAYGEYYPMAGGFEASAGLGDDDDDDATLGKRGGAAGAAGAAGEAGAGPGAKGGPAGAVKGKAGGDKDAARQHTQKLHTQLQKIESLMREKGHDHAAAFAKAPGAGTPARTPSRGATGQDPDLVVGSKRQKRI